MALLSGDAAKAEKLGEGRSSRKRAGQLPLANHVDILWRAGKTAEAKAEFEKARAP